jgi:Putative Flp pilus-assembly TadE/G-like
MQFLDKQLRREDGQAFAFMALFLLLLLAMSAAVLDIGAWYRAQRSLQATVDAAALAGAQALPDDPAQAQALAAQYLAKNGGAGDSTTVTVESQLRGADTIRIKGTRTAPGIFSHVLGINSVQVHAVAAARSGAPGEARWAAPVAVDEKHPMLQCKPTPCFGQATSIDLKKTGPGAFRLLNLDGSRGGISPGTLAEWIEEGYDGSMPLGWYYSDPGAKFNSSQVKSAFDDRVGDELLFPVYRDTRGSGANFEYEVVGFAGYHVDSYDFQGSKGLIYGEFTRVIWQGVQSTTGTAADYGVRSVSLVD